MCGQRSEEVRGEIGRHLGRSLPAGETASAKSLRSDPEEDRVAGAVNEGRAGPGQQDSGSVGLATMAVRTLALTLRQGPP